MKIVTSVLLWTLAASPAFAVSPSKFYGNVLVTGTQGCSVVQGTFPAEVSFASNTSVFYFNILIQNQSIGLPLDFIDVAFTPSSSSSGSALVYDYALFATFAGQTATYTGSPILNAAGNLRVDGGGTPLVLTQVPSGTATPPCVLSFTGTLYFSPN